MPLPQRTVARQDLGLWPVGAANGAGFAEPVPVGNERELAFGGIGPRPRDGLVEVGELFLQSGTAARGRVEDQVIEQGAQSAHDLGGGGAVVADLGEADGEEVLPARHGDDQAHRALVVSDGSLVEATVREQFEDGFDAIEGLHRSGGVVDRGRQRPGGDVDEES